jgi:hypothetical protein
MATSKKARRKKGEPRDKPVSLAPVAFEDALKALLVTKPEPKQPKKSRSKKKPASK